MWGAKYRTPRNKADTGMYHAESAPLPPETSPPRTRIDSRGSLVSEVDGVVSNHITDEPPVQWETEAAKFLQSQCLASQSSSLRFDGILREELVSINRKLDDLLKSTHKGKRICKSTSTAHGGAEVSAKHSDRTSLVSGETLTAASSGKVEFNVVKGLYRRKSQVAPLANGLELVLSGMPPETGPATPKAFGIASWAKTLKRCATMDLRNQAPPEDEIETGESNSSAKPAFLRLPPRSTMLAEAGVEHTECTEMTSKSTGRSLDSEDIARADALLAPNRGGLRCVWSFLEDPESSPAAKWFSKFSSFFICVSVLVTIVQTLKTTPLKGWPAAAIETFIDAAFLLEILLRFISCPNRLVFFGNVFNWIDVATVAPLAVRWGCGFVLPEGEVQSVPHAILWCCVPILRLLKTLRRFESFHLLIKAFHDAAEALPVLLYILTVIAMVFAALIYLVEPRDNIKSLPHSFWLSIVTMTTVGYGDVTPVTGYGSCIIGVLVVTTVLYMAIPLGIIGTAFNDAWQDRDRILLMQRTRDRLCQWGYTAHDIPVLFKISDSNADGELDLKEFRKLLNQMQVGFSEERILKLFNSFDDDGSGTVDDHEFIKALFPESYHDIYDDE